MTGFLPALAQWMLDRGLVRLVPGETEEQLKSRIRSHLNALCRVVGGGPRYIPKMVNLNYDTKQLRDNAILRAHLSGVERDVILRTFRIRKTIYYKIIGRKVSGDSIE